MTLLFIDSFDHYSSGEILKKYTEYSGATITSSYKRNGTSGLSIASNSHYVRKYVPETTTFIVGVGWYSSGNIPTTNNYLIQGYDGTTFQCSVKINFDGSLSATRGTTVLGSTSGGILSGLVWYFIEIKVTIDNSSGIFVIKVNGNEVLNLSGVDTQAGSNNYVNGIRLAGATGFYVDDFYICDNNGDAPQNDFLGDVGAVSLYPSSSGTYAQWQVTGSVSNYQAVDDATPDTTTYTYATGSSLKDAFSMGNLSIGDGEIYGIQTLLYARKDNAGEVLIDPIARINGSDYTLGTGSFSLGDSYTYYRTIEELNPDTTGSWTLSDINNMEFGYNRSA